MLWLPALSFAQATVKIMQGKFPVGEPGHLRHYQGAYILQTTDDLKKKIPHGEGILTRPNLSPEKMAIEGYSLSPYTYAGAWKMGKKHGYGQESCPEFEYKGAYVEDEFHGTGEYLDRETGDTYQGEWQFGMKYGKGTEQTNNFSYTGDYKYGLFHGSGQYTLKSPQYLQHVIPGPSQEQLVSYDGQWKEGKITGKGKIHWLIPGPQGPINVTYEGMLSKGRPMGTGKLDIGIYGTLEGQWNGFLFTGQGTRHYHNPEKNPDFPLGSQITYTGEWVDGQWRSGTLTIDQYFTMTGQWSDAGFNGTIQYTDGQRATTFSGGLRVAKQDIILTTPWTIQSVNRTYEGYFDTRAIRQFPVVDDVFTMPTPQGVFVQIDQIMTQDEAIIKYQLELRPFYPMEGKEVLVLDGYYEGNIQHNKPHGYGTFRFENETIKPDEGIATTTITYTGDWIDGVFSGKGTLEYISSLLATNSDPDNPEAGSGTDIFVYQGGFKDGTFFGPGECAYFVDGSENTFKGNFIDGIIEGKATHEYVYWSSPSLKTITVGDFNNWSIEGIGKQRIFYIEKDINELICEYEGQLMASRRHGRGKARYIQTPLAKKDWQEDVMSYDGEWHEDKPTSKGTIQYRNGTTKKQ